MCRSSLNWVICSLPRALSRRPGAWLKQLVKKNPNSADAHALQAELYAAEKDKGAALVEQRKAVALDPKRADLLSTAGRVAKCY